jgi:hypothetical protein
MNRNFHLFLMSFCLLALSSNLWAVSELDFSDPDRCKMIISKMRGEIWNLDLKNTRCIVAAPKIGPMTEIATCNHLGGGVYQLATRLGWYPQCNIAAEVCSRHATIMRAKQCADSAPESLSSKEKQRVSPIENVERLEEIYKQSRALTDPVVFFKDHLKDKLKSNIVKQILVNDESFTPYGKTAMNETYKFIFDKTVGNETLRSSNPIINAIQGSAAEIIRSQHHNAINKLQTIVNELNNDQISFLRSRGHTNTATSGGRPVGNIDESKKNGKTNTSGCEILTSSNRTEFAISSPEEFAALLDRCSEN